MEKHKVKGKLDETGKWIVYDCPDCDYCKMFSQDGNEMRTISDEDSCVQHHDGTWEMLIAHSGSYSPLQAEMFSISMGKIEIKTCED